MNKTLNHKVAITQQLFNIIVDQFAERVFTSPQVLIKFLFTGNFKIKVVKMDNLQLCILTNN